MPEEFLPETELERAYIQSRGWESMRLWKRARLNTEREEWALAAGLSVSRILDCALNKRKMTFVRTMESIGLIIGQLNEPQKFSLFKCLAHLVQGLLDEDFDLDNKYINVVLHLMLRLFFRTGDIKGGDIVCMMRLMHDIYGGPHWLASFAFLATENNLKMAPSEMLVDFMTPAQRAFFSESVKEKEEVARKFSNAGEITPGAFRAAVRTNRIDRLPISRSSSPVSMDDREYELVHIEAQELNDNSEILQAVGDKRTLVELHQSLVETISRFGFKSSQTANSLIQLAEFANNRKLVPVDKYLTDLTGILEDESVDVLEYDLRRIYSVTGKVQGDEVLSPIAANLQGVIFSRRSKTLGFDMAMALPLTRLIKLWNANGKLAEGEAFCKTILTGASQTFSEDHIIVRQIKSAYERVTELNRETDIPKIGRGGKFVTKLEVDLFEEHEEFVSMLAIVAMDYSQNGRDEEAGAVLQEALSYYLECTSDVARRVGEMLWLLIETDLRRLKSFRDRLIELTIAKAFDDYLRRQFVKNFGRMLKLLDKNECTDAIALASKVSRQLDLAEKGTSKNIDSYWYQLLSQSDRDEVFDQSRFEKELDQLVLPGIETAQGTDGQLSRLSLSRANQLGDKLSDYFLAANQPAAARGVLSGLLAIGNQTKVDVTKLLTRLARVHIAEDNICDATAVLYMAFSDLPSVYDDVGPDEQPKILK